MTLATALTTDRLNNLPKVMQLVNARIRIRTPVACSSVCAFGHQGTLSVYLSCFRQGPGLTFHDLANPY